MEQIVENFHGCYLLRSECANRRFKGRTYIGYTVDPNRRLVKHNKGRKHGGAVRTTRGGPWTVVVIVYGFMTNIAALQFEWAWQHPDESRRLRHVTKKKSRETALAYRIRIMMEMLCVEPWKRLPLTVQWLRSEFQADFPANLQPPDHIAILSGTVKTRKIASTATDRNSDVTGAESQNEETLVVCCRICKEIFEDHRAINVPGIVVKAGATESHIVTCLIPTCAAKFHLLCLADTFLQDEPGLLIPLRGQCPACSTSLLWADLIRFKKGFYRNCVLEAEGEENLLSEIGDAVEGDDLD